MHFADRLINRIAELQNPTCVGLDPRLPQIPSFIQKQQIKKHGKTLAAVAGAIVEFNQGIIDAVQDIVAVVKPQIAFYECYGHEGFRAYEETIRYAQKKGLLVIADAKRNDIGSTATAYAQGFLGKVPFFDQPITTLQADALTVTPYLGSDGIKPFVEQCEAHGGGIFVLVRTSNPSSDEIQGLPVGDQLLDEHVATLVEGWGRELIGESGFSSVGAVVGATYPEEARGLRNLMPNQIFLVPGYGAQGGTAESVKACFHQNGTGAIINSSRDIIFAYEKAETDEKGFAEAARAAALAMKEDLLKLFQ